MFSTSTTKNFNAKDYLNFLTEGTAVKTVTKVIMIIQRTRSLEGHDVFSDGLE